MPAKNVIKVQVPDSYYHIYIRGSNKQILFKEDTDYKYFISLFERYFSDEPIVGNHGGTYPCFLNKVEILAYCLMSNHFHILIYQVDIPFLEKFMHSLMTSYGKYFNLKYKRTGPVFESRYKAVCIDRESYLQHISRYIHLNPAKWNNYRYSSLDYYRNNNAPNWLNTTKILDLFNSTQDYVNFVTDYKEMHDKLCDLKYQLANELDFSNNHAGGKK
jgi:REP element-mobilizing transposase RayT